LFGIGKYCLVLPGNARYQPVSREISPGKEKEPHVKLYENNFNWIEIYG